MRCPPALFLVICLVLTNDQRADRLAQQRGACDLQSKSRRSSVSASNHNPVPPPAGNANGDTGSEPEGPITRNGGRRGASALGRGSGLFEPGKDLKSLRIATVGAKWRRKHAQLLSAVE